jgi:hypothetical protein
VFDIESLSWVALSMLKLQYSIIASVFFYFSWKSIFLTFIGGFLDVYLVTQLGRDIERFLIKKFPGKFKRFSRKNRLLAKFRRRWGIFGISFITPMILGVPLGVIICLGITTNKWLIIRYMTLSILFWMTILLLIKLVI